MEDGWVDSNPSSLVVLHCLLEFLVVWLSSGVGGLSAYSSVQTPTWPSSSSFLLSFSSSLLSVMPRIFWGVIESHGKVSMNKNHTDRSAAVVLPSLFP